MKAEAETRLKRASQMTAGYALAGLFGLFALIYVTIAAYTGLSNEMEPAASAGIIAAVFVILAVLGVLIAKRKGSKAVSA